MVRTAKLTADPENPAPDINAVDVKVDPNPAPADAVDVKVQPEDSPPYVAEKVADPILAVKPPQTQSAYYRDTRREVTKTAFSIGWMMVCVSSILIPGYLQGWSIPFWAPFCPMLAGSVLLCLTFHLHCVEGIQASQAWDPAHWLHPGLQTLVGRQVTAFFTIVSTVCIYYAARGTFSYSAAFAPLYVMMLSAACFIDWGGALPVMTCWVLTTIISLVLAGLQLDGLLNTEWTFIWIPLFISVVMLPAFIGCIWASVNEELSLTFVRFACCTVAPFLVLLTLKIGDMEMSWFVVFIPLFLELCVSVNLVLPYLVDD